MNIPAKGRDFFLPESRRNDEALVLPRWWCGEFWGQKMGNHGGRGPLIRSTPLGIFVSPGRRKRFKVETYAQRFFCLLGLRDSGTFATRFEFPPGVLTEQSRQAPMLRSVRRQQPSLVCFARKTRGG